MIIGIKAIQVRATIILQFSLLMNDLYRMGNTSATNLSIVNGIRTGMADILKIVNSVHDEMKGELFIPTLKLFS